MICFELFLFLIHISCETTINYLLLDLDSETEEFSEVPASPALSMSSLPSLSGSEISLGQLDNISLEEMLEVPVIVSTNTHCFSCRLAFDNNIMSGNCFQCNSSICMTIPCNIDDLCKLCYNQQQMDSERDDARRKTQKQADKMLEASRKRFGVAKVGDTVLLAIPDLDRGRCEFPNLTAIVLEVNDGGLYKLGCRSGILDSLYSRNQFSPTLESFLTLADVDMEKTLALRTAAGEIIGEVKVFSSVLVLESV